MRSTGVLCVLLLGCGGSAYQYSESGGAATVPAERASRGYGGMEEMSMAAPEPTVGIAMDSEASYGGGGGDFDAWESVEDAPARAESPPAAPPPPQYAQNQPRPQGTTGQPQAGQQQASDAVDLSQPLLIYTADLHLGVYEVEATQETILGAVRELGGHLAQRSDAVLVVRVPAGKFEQALDAIEEAGDVIHRNVQVLDVSEEFRDIAIRIRNAEAVRDRLEQLLRQANNVQEALAVERELERVTESIERMKGRLRWLSDRIAFSTITVRFQARGNETIQPESFRLPFPWLDQLGLSHLLTL